MISLLFSLLAVSIFSWRFPTELLSSCLLAFISSIVGVAVSVGAASLLAIVVRTSVLFSVVSSISVNNFANIGKLAVLSALATNTVFSLVTTDVFSTLALGTAK